MPKGRNTYPLHLEEMAAALYRKAIKRISKKIIPHLKAKYPSLKTDNVGPDYIAELKEELERYCLSNGFIGSLYRISRSLENWTQQQVYDAVDALKNLESKDYMLLAIEKSIDSPEMLNFRELYVQRNRDLVENLGKEYIEGVSEAAYEGFLSGLSTDELSDRMLEYTDGDINKADFWARDQLGDAYSACTEKVHTQAGIVKYTWRTVGDNHVRGNSPKDETDHTQLEGMVFTWEEGAADIPDAFSKPGAKNPGEDYNCVTGDTSIFFDSNIIRCYRRWYDGELTEIVSDSGKTIRLTGNHPINTTSGWKPAKAIKEGDNLFQIPDELIDLPEFDITNRITSAEDVFDLFALLLPVERVGGLTSQFHGDGTEKKVDVITVDGELVFKRNHFFNKYIRKLFFSHTNKMPMGIFVSSLRKLVLCFLRSLFSSNCIVGTFGEFRSIFVTHLRKSDNVGERPISGRYSDIDYSISDSSAGETVFNGASQLAHSGCVIINESYLIDNLVIPRVISVRVFPFHGYLYNFETVSSIYYGNQLSIHNCRCTAEPYADDDDESESE